MKILSPYISCVVNAPLGEGEPDALDNAIKQGYSQIYVVSPDGVIKHHRLSCGKRYVQVKVDSIPGLNQTSTLKEEINFLPSGKIPYELFQKVVCFFKEVIKAGNASLEAMIWILWSPEKGYYLHVPEQKVSGARAVYDWDGLPEGASIIVDIHSHGASIGAGFSGTDNKDDDNSIRFSGVVGRINQDSYEHVWRFSYLGRRFTVQIDDIFNIPKEASFEIPKEWMEMVTPLNNTLPTTYGVKPGKKGKSWVDDDVWDRSWVRTPAFVKAVEESQKRWDESFKKKDQSELPVLPPEDDADMEDEDAWVDLFFDEESISEHPRFDEIMVNHGYPAAMMFCMMDNISTELSKVNPSLYKEALSDGVLMLGAEEQIRMFHDLYTMLPKSERDRLAQFGF